MKSPQEKAKELNQDYLNGYIDCIKAVLKDNSLVRLLTAAKTLDFAIPFNVLNLRGEVLNDSLGGITRIQKKNNIWYFYWRPFQAYKNEYKEGWFQLDELYDNDSKYIAKEILNHINI